MVHDVHELQRRAQRAGQPRCDVGGQQRRLGRVERAEDRSVAHTRSLPSAPPQSRTGSARGSREEWTARHHVRPRWSHDGEAATRRRACLDRGRRRVRRVRGLPRRVAGRRRERRRGVGADARTCGSTSRSTGSARSTRCWRPGIGAVVFAYGAAYLPLHLEHERRPATEGRRFWPWMTLFMVSMVGLACARDLILLFVFFDLTAVASYFLIGFDRDRREARGAALMALLVTGVSAVALLLGAVLLYDEYGTFSLPELFERARAGTTTTRRLRADRRRRAGQERAGAAALLAAARDGGADAGVGLPALGRDGGGRRARARPRPSAARARPDGARRAARRRAGVDRRRRRAGARPGRAQADPRPLDDLAVRLRRRPLRDRRRRRRGRRGALRAHARDRQERAVHDRRRGDGGDRRVAALAPRRPGARGCRSSPPRAAWRPRRSPRCR